MNSPLIICAILIIALSVYYRVSTSKTLKWREELPLLAITLSINFLGLVAALYLNRKEIKNQEKENTIKLLSVAMMDISETLKNTTMMLPLLDNNNNPTQYEFVNYIKWNPIRFPDRFSMLLNNEILLRNISYESFAALTLGHDELKKLLHVCLTSKENDSKMYFYVDSYCFELKYNLSVLKHEIDYLNNDITKSQLKLEMYDLNYERCERIMLRNF